MPSTSTLVTVIGSYVLAALALAGIIVLAATGRITGETAIAGIFAALGVSGGVVGASHALTSGRDTSPTHTMPRTDDVQ